MDTGYIKPEGYEDNLSSYGVQLHDGCSGEPIGWGFEIVKHMVPEKFNGLRMYGELACLYPTWFLIVKKLTREEAIKKYGEITNEEFGPRGGWKSVTFGTTTFLHDYLRPQK